MSKFPNKYKLLKNLIVNEEIISINLYDIEGFDSPDIRETETTIQDAYPTTLLLDNDSEDLSTGEIESSDNASSNFGGFFHG